MAQLTGKTIIITGSSRGVGADTAQILAPEGSAVREHRGELPLQGTAREQDRQGY